MVPLRIIVFRCSDFTRYERLIDFWLFFKLLGGCPERLAAGARDASLSVSHSPGRFYNDILSLSRVIWIRNHLFWSGPDWFFWIQVRFVLPLFFVINFETYCPYYIQCACGIFTSLTKPIKKGFPFIIKFLWWAQLKPQVQSVNPYVSFVTLQLYNFKSNSNLYWYFEL